MVAVLDTNTTDLDVFIYTRLSPNFKLKVDFKTVLGVDSSGGHF